MPATAIGSRRRLVQHEPNDLVHRIRSASHDLQKGEISGALQSPGAKEDDTKLDE